MKKSEEFLKKVKTKKGFLIGGIILIIFALFLGSIYITDYLDVKNNPENIKDDVVVSADHYVELEVHLMTDYFAVTDDRQEKKSYIVLDENMNMYIAVLNEENVEKLQDILAYSYDEIENAPKPIKIYGMTKDIPEDLKKLAIDYYNDGLEENLLTDANFENIMGYVYIDTFASPSSSLISGLIASTIVLIVGIIVILIYLKRNKTTNKTLEQYKDQMDKIYQEIDNENTIYNKHLKLYITNNYLITYYQGLEIILLNDIYWLYPHEYHNRGLVSKSIYITTNDGKMRQTGQININKKTKEIFDEIYVNLVKKLPNALLGYSKENVEKVKILKLNNKK
ncbi:MAG: hypothetical protein E7172_00565 [Firmicutes bacterium]|nr:hypothetical protein [Bacillota bacterium]